jgi:large subunit ribosomal protein L9
MELILLKHVRGLGNIGDIVNVARGYARNFLMPKELAMRASEDNKQEILKRKVELDQESKKLQEEAKLNIDSYIDKQFVFIKSSSDGQNLYGSLSTKEIAENISTDSFKVKAENIHLSKPIKKIGTFEAILSLHPEVECKIFINVAKNETEAKLFVAPVIENTSDSEL